VFIESRFAAEPPCNADKQEIGAARERDECASTTGPARVVRAGFPDVLVARRRDALMVKHNPNGLFPPYRCYSHAIEIPGGSRLLVISGPSI